MYFYDRDSLDRYSKLLKRIIPDVSFWTEIDGSKINIKICHDIIPGKYYDRPHEEYVYGLSNYYDKRIFVSDETGNLLFAIQFESFYSQMDIGGDTVINVYMPDIDNYKKYDEFKEKNERVNERELEKLLLEKTITILENELDYYVAQKEAELAAQMAAAKKASCPLRNILNIIGIGRKRER